MGKKKPDQIGQFLAHHDNFMETVLRYLSLLKCCARLGPEKSFGDLKCQLATKQTAASEKCTEMACVNVQV